MIKNYNLELFLSNYFGKNIQEDITKHPIVIAHTDAPELAEKLAEMVKQKYGENVKIDFVMVNPTAGAHCGPNCVGIAFHAKHR